MTVNEHDSAIEVFLPAEGTWVQTEVHRRDSRGWVAYQAGERVGIAPPEHWRACPPKDIQQTG
jgi:hypothetical protein